MKKKFLVTEQNVAQYAKKISNFIKETVENTKSNGVVFGMSGGIDCSLVTALCHKAGVKILLVMMPYGDSMKRTKDKDDAMELIEKFNVDYTTVDITATVDALEKTLKEAVPTNKGENIVFEGLALSNIRPRVRMTTVYAIGQSMGYLVGGTGNLSERTVGYSTKWGDGGHDFNPIGNLTKTEVRIMARYLGVPSCIIDKAPSAGLWAGQTDEDEMGVKYSEIDDYIITGGENISKEAFEMIKGKEMRNRHKAEMPPIWDEK
ncbi:MAG: NAD(+) synthase [Sarcina sp.]